jgi:hypothetical protein
MNKIGGIELNGCTDYVRRVNCSVVVDENNISTLPFIPCGEDSSGSSIDSAFVNVNFNYVKLRRLTTSVKMAFTL